jgi:hypothetical protein
MKNIWKENGEQKRLSTCKEKDEETSRIRDWEGR